ETFGGLRVNEKIAQFLRNSEKANRSSLPSIPRIVAMVRREPEEEKGAAGTPVTCVILPLVPGKVGIICRTYTIPTGQLSHLPIRGPFPRPGNIINGHYQFAV
ncbi:hypothetical protein TNCV_4957801, partial [Trichonephila clavipes]